ncbi:Ehd1 [Symbiodinium pilosum]|uniref:Ehd1 protein n=1 Tax=Symbiodinium pilosum TaxID=2952 RepID=A0A812IZ64_SYMPI|nr:Ehd1 [Symbiodinium pilosum]
MLEWLDSSEGSGVKVSQVYDSVTTGLQAFYRTKLLPIERDHLFHQFYSPELTDADFASAPMVLLMGQYSTGKTTFIRHLLQRDYPGMRIGPEPTTDRFVCVLHGDSDSVTPGNALVVDHELPFTQLSHFGNAFLSRLEASRLSSPVLEGLTLIDTPGVLSGEKQRIKRGYEFEAVVKWFADRVDMILLFFDVSKLDISDEFRRVIQATKGNDHKICILLNKADNVTTQQLMRVYGALMWSLGKVLDTPEVARVYVGTFWDQPLKNEKLRELFEQEENDLYTKIAQLPRSASLRKVNDLIKRARLAKVHAMLLDYFYKRMPTFFGHAKEQERMIQDLPNIYQEIAVQKGIPLGDFPDPRMMQQILTPMDFSTFKPVDGEKLQALEALLAVDLPKLLQLIPEEQMRHGIGDAAIAQVVGMASPFAVMKVEGNTEQSAYKGQWHRIPAVEDFKAGFDELHPMDGKINAQQAKQKMVESHLPSNVLHRIWSLADVDKDGFLTLPEYAIAMHLVQMKLDGQDLPTTLPQEMLPEELKDV